jgi:hypothetical protein
VAFEPVVEEIQRAFVGGLDPSRMGRAEGEKRKDVVPYTKYRNTSSFARMPRRGSVWFNKALAR